MYKFVTLAEYNSTYAASHPDARVSPDGTEVVLSEEGNLTREEAIAYIAANWDVEEDA